MDPPDEREFEDKYIYDEKTCIHYRKSIPMAKILWYVQYVLGETGEPWEIFKKSKTLGKFIKKD